MKTSLAILLASGEGQFVEYKSCFDRTNPRHPKPRTAKSIAKDIAINLAEFANTDGGTLLVGVENDGDATGVPFTMDEISTIERRAANSWRNPVPYHREIAEHPKGRIIVFEVDPQAEVFSLTDGRTPYRNNEQTVWIHEEEIRSLKKAKAGTLIERTIMSAFAMNDLDDSLLQRFREAIGAGKEKATEELMVEHDLAVKSGSGVTLTLAACLLFGKPPMTRFHERCGINFRKFDGTVALSGAKNNERMEETRELPLPRLMEETFKIVQNQIGTSRKLRDLFFEERPEYPTYAWQEAIVNAVAHRDYSLRGNEIEIRMFDDRLEIKSPGLPPEPVTLEDLQERRPVHASRNPRIMRVLKALKFVRERGEGLPRMFEETEQSFLPPPEISSEGRFFKIMLANTPVYNDDTMSWLRSYPIEGMTIGQRRILAEIRQTRRGCFVLRDYARINHVDKETSRKEIKGLIDQRIIEVVGSKKAAKYYPILQRGSMDDLLRDFFSRHSSLTNTEYRELAGGIHVVTASIQLRKLVSEGKLKKEGSKRGTRYHPTTLLLKTK